MKNIVIGFLGTNLDQSRKNTRWGRWRPSVAICQQEGFKIDRFDLIFSEKHTPLAKRITEDIQETSSETKVKHHLIELNDPWDLEEVYGKMDDFCHSYPFKPEKEAYYIHITTGTHVVQICSFLLAESRRLPGKLIQTFPNKKQADPKGGYSIIDLDLARYDQLATRFQKEHLEGLAFLKSGIKTRNLNYNLLIEEIETVVIRSEAPLLLQGPTGAGKSQLARRIYDLKKNKHQIKGDFVEINCATIKGDTALSTLFGHKKGAFTGATQDRAGLLKKADRGLLFLDEIGELGIDEQAMLLRAIEEHRFSPMGSDKEVESNFQLIAGTNRDLLKEVTTGKFREDLLARINLWTFTLPPLKNRPEDIEPNIEYELLLYSQKSGDSITFNKEAQNKFLQFAKSPDALWKANFRDLNASISRMATLANGGRITLKDVQKEITRLKATWNPHNISYPTQKSLSQFISEEDLEKIDPFDLNQLAYVINICKQHSTLTEAGRYLFSVSRTQNKSKNDAHRLRMFLKRFGLDWKKIKNN